MSYQNRTIVPWLLVIFAILFLTNLAMSQDWDIYVYDVHSGETKQISNTPDQGEYMPIWSPNGKKIAHDHWSHLLGHTVIMITDVNTRESTILEGTEGSAGHPAWSPNGQWIAFDRWPMPDGIYILPPDGGIPRLVIEDALDPDWSPNSKRLVFYRPSDGTIRTVNIDNPTDMTVIASAFSPVYPPEPQWSPNGKWIAYGNPDEDPEFAGIWKVRVNIKGESLTPPEPIYIGGCHWNPTWSNDHKRLAFISTADNCQGDYDIWTISADGNNPTRLTGLVGYGDYNPSFSRNGRYIAYSGYTEPQLPKTKSSPNVDSELPTMISLVQNYPNPFNPTTTIKYQIPELSFVTLKVYDVLGREVAILVNEKKSVGSYEVEFNATSLPSGVYFYRLQAGSFVETKKMVLMK